MPQELKVILPQLGETVVEGTVVKWLVTEGSRVRKDEPLAEISTDKANAEIPAPAEGLVAKILVSEGQTVAVGETLLLLEVGERIAAQAPSKPIPETAATPEKVGGLRGAEEAPAPGKRYSPVVLKMAVEHGIDLDQIQGTGLGGRVSKQDLLDYMESGKPAVEKSPAPGVTTAAPTPPEAGEKEEVVPLIGRRKAIAEHMSRSKRTAAHVTTVAEVDVTKLADLRKHLQPTFEKEHSVHLTFMPFFVAAAASALKEFPYLNSSITEDSVILKKYINVGVAVSTDAGLVVPVIRDTDKKELATIAKEINTLAANARAGKLKIADVEGGTFTITNPGVFGAVLSTPIIHQPQVAILSTQTIKKVPVVVDDAIAIRSMMYLCLSYDHRVVDGDTAIRFLQHIKNQIEACHFSL